MQTVHLVGSVFVSRVAIFRTSPRPSRPKRPADEIVTHGLTVVDDRGKMRASIGTAKDGASIALFDEEECPRISMVLSNREGPELSLTDLKGSVTVELRHDATGPHMALADSDGKRTVINHEGSRVKHHQLLPAFAPRLAAEGGSLAW